MWADLIVVHVGAVVRVGGVNLEPDGVPLGVNLFVDVGDGAGREAGGDGDAEQQDREPGEGDVADEDEQPGELALQEEAWWQTDESVCVSPGRILNALFSSVHSLQGSDALFRWAAIKVVLTDCDEDARAHQHQAEEQDGYAGPRAGAGVDTAEDDEDEGEQGNESVCADPDPEVTENDLLSRFERRDVI